MAVPTVKEVGYGDSVVTLENRNITNQSGAGTHRAAIQVPSRATRATFYLNLISVGGTTPTLDFALHSIDPTAFDDANIHPLGSGGDGAITQLTAAGDVAVFVGEGAAGDDTGTTYHIASPLPRFLLYTVTIDGTTGDEDYNYTLAVDFHVK